MALYILPVHNRLESQIIDIAMREMERIKVDVVSRITTLVNVV